MFEAYTDASVREGVSLHSFCVFNNNCEFIVGKVFKNNFKDSHEAELHSIKELLKYCIMNNVKVIKVNTDCKGLLSNTDNEIRKLMDEVNAELKWISRRNNSLAHRACTSGDSNFFNVRSDNRKIKSHISSIKTPKILHKGHVKLNNVNKSEKQKMYDLYLKLTNDFYRYTVDDILKWAENRETINTKVGRKYIVKEFIEEFYLNEVD